MARAHRRRRRGHRRFVVMATGCLSMPKQPRSTGVEQLRRRGVLHQPLAARGRRLHRQAGGGDRHGFLWHPVDPAHRRAGAAAGGVPAHAELLDPGAQRPAVARAARATRSERGRTTAARRGCPRAASRWSAASPRHSASPEAERQQRYERAWETGELFEAINVYADVLSNPAANDEFAEFFRNKIRAIVDDPQTATDLCPTDYPFGTKRPCLDTNYYATYNLPHVRLVDLRKHPIRQDHRDRHRHRRRVVRVRRDRLRHRLRRHDGRDAAVDITGP